MDALERELRAAVQAYQETTSAWTEEPGIDVAETSRRRLLARSHAQRILRRLRAELQSVRTSFERAASTAPDIVLTQPAHELWQSGSAALEAALRRGPEPEEVARLRTFLASLEAELAGAKV